MKTTKVVKDVSIKISKKHYKLLLSHKAKTRIPIKSTIEMAIEAAMADGDQDLSEES